MVQMKDCINSHKTCTDKNLSAVIQKLREVSGMIKLANKLKAVQDPSQEICSHNELPESEQKFNCRSEEVERPTPKPRNGLFCCRREPSEAVDCLVQGSQFN